MDTVLNTCYETTQSLRVIANYSHVIPVVLSVALGLFVLIKAKSSLLSRIFLSFIFAFSAWLIGDLIIWGSNDYHLIYAIWSVLVHFEVIFFVLQNGAAINVCFILQGIKMLLTIAITLFLIKCRLEHF
jgi:hypothetical protein